MAIEQTLFSIQRSVLQPKAVPALFSQYQWLLSDLFIILTVHPAGMSIVLSPRHSVSRQYILPLPEFWNESTSNGVTPV